MMKILLFSIFIILFKNFQQASSSICPEVCVEDNCGPPSNCYAGITKDRCNCCYVCGGLEGQRCYNKSLKILPKSYQRYPTCGDNLVCEIRDDLADGDQAEAICVCKFNEPICGSDGITYENLCKLTEQRYMRRDGLTTSNRGPCKTAPKITSAPDNIFNSTDTNVAFSCEASGYPIPYIEWRFISKKESTEPGDEKPIQLKYLPSDDSHIAVQSRGGPNTYEVTSWLQILRTQVSDTGYYHCIARNSEGEDSAFGKLTIVEKGIPNNHDNLNEFNEIQK